MNTAQILVKRMFEQHVERIRAEKAVNKELSDNVNFFDLSIETRRLVRKAYRYKQLREAAKAELERRGLSTEVEVSRAGRITHVSRSYSSRREAERRRNEKQPLMTLGEIRNRAQRELLNIKGGQATRDYLTKIEAEMAAVTV